ncbi:MAG: hypothetical protein ACK4IT_03915 [Thioalkalivibrionaceae bacterium]
MTAAWPVMRRVFRIVLVIVSSVVSHWRRFFAPILKTGARFDTELRPDRPAQRVPRVLHGQLMTIRERKCGSTPSDVAGSAAAQVCYGL